MMETGQQKDGLLKGIRILDLADEKASFCSKLLADMGADVIKVERPGGDPSRRIGPFLGNSPHPERSLFFFHHNTNKQGITLNLEHPDGKQILCRLIEKADILVESFMPGRLEELGLGFETLRGVNQKLILVSVTGFGQNGPRKDYTSCDIVTSAFGGQMYVSGALATPPLKAFGEQSCYTASLFAAIGILLALRKRARTGKGEHIDISMQEAAVSTSEHVLIRYFYESVIAKRQGSLHWNNSFCTLPCMDGHILISLFQQWETLIEWMDSEGMAGDLKDGKYEQEEFRQNHINHIIEVVQRWTKTHTAHELFESGQLMRFPWSPIYSPNQVLRSPQLKSRGFFFDVDHPEASISVKYAGPPYKFNGYSLNRRQRAPLIGEDNAAIYQGELGLSDAELERLAAVHVI